VKRLILIGAAALAAVFFYHAGYTRGWANAQQVPTKSYAAGYKAGLIVGQMPDYTDNVRASVYRAGGADAWCKAYNGPGTPDAVQAREYCEDAMTDSCIVYLELCHGLHWTGTDWE